MTTIHPVSLNVASPHFGGEFRRTLQGLAGSVLNINDKLDRYDRVRDEKALPLYEKIFGDFLHLGRVKTGRKNRAKLKEIDTALTTALSEKGFSKTGGLKSAYWQAFHWPAVMLESKEDKNTDITALHDFVMKVYLPLLTCLDNEDQYWTVSSILKGFANTGSPEKTVGRVRQLKDIQTAQPEYWRATLRLMPAFWQVAGTLYGGLPLSEAQRDDLYMAARDGFVADVLGPWLDAVANDDSVHAVTKDFMETVLPEVLDSFGANNPAGWLVNETGDVIGFQQLMAGVKADMLETLWRMQVLDGDLKNKDMDTDVSDQFRNTIARLRDEAKPESKTFNGPDLPITHCNLPAVVPPRFVREA